MAAQRAKQGPCEEIMKERAVLLQNIEIGICYVTFHRNLDPARWVEENGTFALRAESTF